MNGKKAGKGRVKTEISSGGVIYRRNDGKIEIVLISTRGGRTLSLPKGLIEPGENPEQAAIREVQEETGCRGEIEDFLGKIEYWYSLEGAKIHKFVYYYLIKYTSGDVNLHDREVEQASWFDIEQAIEKASYENEREVIRLALQKLRNRHT